MAATVIRNPVRRVTANMNSVAISQYPYTVPHDGWLYIQLSSDKATGRYGQVTCNGVIIAGLGGMPPADAEAPGLVTMFPVWAGDVINVRTGVGLYSLSLLS